MNGKELFKGIKACIFDLDGTLVDSLGIWAEVDKKYFLVHKSEIPEDYYKKMPHIIF